jgi:hypothetical protein
MDVNSTIKNSINKLMKEALYGQPPVEPEKPRLTLDILNNTLLNLKRELLLQDLVIDMWSILVKRLFVNNWAIFMIDDIYGKYIIAVSPDHLESTLLMTKDNYETKTYFGLY